MPPTELSELIAAVDHDHRVSMATFRDDFNVVLERNETKVTRSGRRRFLVLAGAAVIAGTVVPLPRLARIAAAEDDNAVMVAVSAAALEYAAVEVYSAAVGSGKLTPVVREAAVAFGAHHLEHGNAFAAIAKRTRNDIGASKDVLGAAVEQLAAATTEADVAAIALGIENAAVSVYVNALGSVTDLSVIGSMVSILPIESAHAVVLGQVLALPSHDPRFLPAFEK
jgi:Ferritin-like domain